jgi:hypothetical protein
MRFSIAFIQFPMQRHVAFLLLEPVRAPMRGLA